MANTGMDNVLTSKDEILAYTGLSKHTYIKFLKMGLPVLYIDGRCYAHKDNIDEFFKKVTRVNSSKAEDE
jgi:hypothetical protein